MRSNIKANKEELLLGDKIDSDLTLKEYVASICSKVYINKDFSIHWFTEISEFS